MGTKEGQLRSHGLCLKASNEHAYMGSLTMLVTLKMHDTFSLFTGIMINASATSVDCDGVRYLVTLSQYSMMESSVGGGGGAGGGM